MKINTPYQHPYVPWKSAWDRLHHQLFVERKKLANMHSYSADIWLYINKSTLSIRDISIQQKGFDRTKGLYFSFSFDTSIQQH
jgi:hypothetical protein